MFIYKRTPRRTRLGDLCPSPTATSPPPPRRPSSLSPRFLHPPIALRPPSAPIVPVLSTLSVFLPPPVCCPHPSPSCTVEPSCCAATSLSDPQKAKSSTSTGPPGGSASCRTHSAESPLRAAAAVGFCLDLHVSETKFVGRAGWCGSNNVQWYFLQMLKYLFLTNLK